MILLPFRRFDVVPARGKAVLALSRQHRKFVDSLGKRIWPELDQIVEVRELQNLLTRALPCFYPDRWLFAGGAQ